MATKISDGDATFGEDGSKQTKNRDMDVSPSKQGKKKEEDGISCFCKATSRSSVDFSLSEEVELEMESVLKHANIIWNCETIATLCLNVKDGKVYIDKATSRSVMRAISPHLSQQQQQPSQQGFFGYYLWRFLPVLNSLQLGMTSYYSYALRHPLPLDLSMFCKLQYFGLKFMCLQTEYALSTPSYCITWGCTHLVTFELCERG
eukprot:m.10666 g.10666  ORF g.10666 m.10666 type:complete len:204 (-) comp6664_c0_seq1:967-1578(-)